MEVPPCLTERLLMGRKESSQTKTLIGHYHLYLRISTFKHELNINYSFVIGIVQVLTEYELKLKSFKILNFHQCTYKHIYF